MTRSNRVITRYLKNGSSSRKGVIFDHDGLAMDQINVESLSSAPMDLVSYGTFEEDAPAPITLENQSPSPIEESPST